MGYLISQMWLCLLLAALLGTLIGWWLRGSNNRREIDELNASWQQKYDQQEKNYTAKLSQTTQAQSLNKSKTSDLPPLSHADKSTYPIEEIEGIGKAYGEKLRQIGIATTQQLLKKAANMEGRTEIANHIGIEDFVVRKWASMSDLMRIAGIDGQFAELIVYSGIDSSQHLGEEEASVLYNKLKKANNEQNRVKEIPSYTSLEIMIALAAGMPVALQDI